MKIISIWIGDEIDSRNHKIVNQNLKKCKNFDFYMFSAEQAIKKIGAPIPDSRLITISDISRVSFLKEDLVYMDCDFVMVNCDFSNFLKKYQNNVLPESPFVLANGFMHISCSKLQKDYLDTLIENSKISEQSPHIVSGPYALTRFVCSKVWNNEASFDLIRNSDVLILPGFVNPSILDWKEIRYAYSNSCESSWIEESQNAFRYGRIRSLIWYLINQSKTHSLILFLLKAFANSFKLRKFSLTGNYSRPILMEVIVSILDLCVTGKVIEFPKEFAGRFVESTLQSRSLNLWTLLGDDGLFGCVVTDSRSVGVEILSSGVSEICVLSEDALLSWTDGESQYVWSSVNIPFMNVRICFRKNFHRIRHLGPLRDKCQ